MSSMAQPSSAARETAEISVQPKSAEETLRALRTLLDGDEREQRETFACLKEALDEDRSSSRKLFSSS